MAKLTRNEFHEQYGSRKLARALINNAVMQICGIGINDLPDTAQLCSMVDELEEIVDQHEGALDGPEFTLRSQEFLTENITESFVQNTIFD